MKRLIIVLMISLTGYAIAHAAGLETERRVEQAIETSMNLLKETSIEEFLESLRPFWTKPESEINAMKEQMAGQRIEARKRFGKTLGVQQVDFENVKDTLIRIHYIEKFEKAAMRWTFNFYKPEAAWHLDSFIWDQNTDVLFSND